MIISCIPIHANCYLEFFDEFNKYTYYIIEGLSEIIKSKIIIALAEKNNVNDESVELLLSPYDNLPIMLILHKQQAVIICKEYLPQKFTSYNKIIINTKSKIINNKVTEEIKLIRMYISDLKARVDNYIQSLSIVEHELESEFQKIINHQKITRFITRMIQSEFHSGKQQQVIRYSNLLSSDIPTYKNNCNTYLLDKFGTISSNIIKQASIRLSNKNLAYILFVSQICNNKFDGIFIPKINQHIILSTDKHRNKIVNCNRFINHKTFQERKYATHILYDLKSELAGECKTIIKTIQKLNKIVNSYYCAYNNDDFIMNIAEIVNQYINHSKCFT